MIFLGQVANISMQRIILKYQLKTFFDDQGKCTILSSQKLIIRAHVYVLL